MDNSLSKQATDWREGRRLRAFELKQQGWSQQRIAEALGVSKGAVSQWMKRSRDGGGVQALKRRPAPGARPRLSEASAPRCRSLEAGARLTARGWTCERVLYDPQGVGGGYHPLISRFSRLLGKACRTSAGCSAGEEHRHGKIDVAFSKKGSERAEHTLLRRRLLSVAHGGFAPTPRCKEPISRRTSQRSSA